MAEFVAAELVAALAEGVAILAEVEAGTGVEIITGKGVALGILEITVLKIVIKSTNHNRKNKIGTAVIKIFNHLGQFFIHSHIKIIPKGAMKKRARIVTINFHSSGFWATGADACGAGFTGVVVCDLLGSILEIFNNQ